MCIRVYIYIYIYISIILLNTTYHHYIYKVSFIYRENSLYKYISVIVAFIHILLIFSYNTNAVEGQKARRRGPPVRAALYVEKGKGDTPKACGKRNKGKKEKEKKKGKRRKKIIKILYK